MTGLLAPLRELRVTLSQMRPSQLAVGPDGRNRSLPSAFRARTGRNQPSNTRFVLGPAVWLRGLIRPRPGYGLAYIDWSQQEFGIAITRRGNGRPNFCPEVLYVFWTVTKRINDRKV